MATLGAARAIGSEHFLLAHGRKTLRAGLMDAEKLSTDSAAMTDDDSRDLREAGFTDRQIVDITLAAERESHRR